MLYSGHLRTQGVQTWDGMYSFALVSTTRTFPQFCPTAMELLVARERYMFPGNQTPYFVQPISGQDGRSLPDHPAVARTLGDRIIDWRVPGVCSKARESLWPQL